MAKEKNPVFGDKVITGEGRCSFPKLAEPDNSKFGQGKYSVDMIFESEDEMASLKKACIAHAKMFYKTDDVSDIKFPWRDGNENSKYAGYEGNQFIRARSKNEPAIVDGNRRALDPKKIYGGCTIRLNLTPMAYELEDEVIVIENGERKNIKEKIKGITVLLNAVQFVGDNERFGGGGDGFDDKYADESEGVSDDTGF